MKVRPTAGPPPADLRLCEAQKARSKPVGVFAVLPEVQTLVTKYKPNRDDSIRRPAERVLNRVLTVDRFLTDHADARSLASAMLKDDLRTPLFQLEGPLRLYKPRFGRDFEKALERVKALEDRLGEVLLRRELAALAAEKKFPSAVIGGLRKDERRAMTELEELVARDWTPNPHRRDQVPALDFVIGRVLDADFGSDEKDVKFLRLAMAEDRENRRNEVQPE